MKRTFQDDIDDLKRTTTEEVSNLELRGTYLAELEACEKCEDVFEAGRIYQAVKQKVRFLIRTKLGLA